MVHFSGCIHHKQRFLGPYPRTLFLVHKRNLGIPTTETLLYIQLRQKETRFMLISYRIWQSSGTHIGFKNYRSCYSPFTMASYYRRSGHTATGLDAAPSRVADVLRQRVAPSATAAAAAEPRPPGWHPPEWLQAPGAAQPLGAARAMGPWLRAPGSLHRRLAQVSSTPSQDYTHYLINLESRMRTRATLSPNGCILHFSRAALHRYHATCASKPLNNHELSPTTV